MERRWCLRDFGSLQFIWDALTGVFTMVYGQRSVVQNGPWELVQRDNHAELVSLDCKDNGDRETLHPDQFSSWEAKVIAVNEVFIGPRSASMDKFVPLSVWRDQHIASYDCHGLKLPVSGYAAPFQAVFTWRAIPAKCGDKPVSLWIDFTWLLSWVYGKKGCDMAWRHVQSLKGYLDSVGLDESHVADSRRSQTRKVRRTGPEDSSAKTCVSSEWCISMMAAILFLDRVASDDRLGKKSFDDTTSSSKAQALLSTFLEWPRHGEPDLAFDFSRTGCQLILRGSTVDHATLKQSEIERSGNSGKFLRLSSLIDSDSDIADLLDARKGKLRRRSALSEVSVNKLTVFIVEFAEAFADLWESTKGDPAWGEFAVSDIGVLTTAWGKCRPVPTSYISAVVTEVKDDEVQGGLRSVKHVVNGLARTHRKTIKINAATRIRFGRKSHFMKLAKKLAKRSANSQRSASHPEATNFGRRATPWERMRYLDKARKLARGQKRISLAMDATDVSKKKYMNATACLPRLNVVCWLPPMDLGWVPGVPGPWSTPRGPG